MGELDLILPPGKGGRLPWVETYDPRLGAGSSAGGANSVNYYRVRFSDPAVSPITGLMFLVTLTGGNVRVGIFDSADGGATLDPRAISASTAVAAATAVQRVPFAAAFAPVLEKDYWLAFGADSVTPTFWRSSAPSSTLNVEGAIALSKASAFAMDAQVGTLSGAAITFWLRTY